MSRLSLVVVLYQATRTHGTAPLVPTSPTCIECTDQPNAYMDQYGLACDDYPYAYDKLCTHNDNWRSRKFCQRSCYENGAGYDGDVCCEAAPPSAGCTQCTDQPNAYMDQNGLACDDYPYAYDKLCTHNDNWRSRKFCQRSCYENGAGYDGDVCCAEKIAPECAKLGKSACKNDSTCKWKNKKSECVDSPAAPDVIDDPAWLIAAAGICSDLNVTLVERDVGMEESDDTEAHFIADIDFFYYPQDIAIRVTDCRALPVAIAHASRGGPNRQPSSSPTTRTTSRTRSTARRTRPRQLQSSGPALPEPLPNIPTAARRPTHLPLPIGITRT